MLEASFSMSFGTFFQLEFICSKSFYDVTATFQMHKYFTRKIIHSHLVQVSHVVARKRRCEHVNAHRGGSQVSSKIIQNHR